MHGPKVIHKLFFFMSKPSVGVGQQVYLKKNAQIHTIKTWREHYQNIGQNLVKISESIRNHRKKMYNFKRKMNPEEKKT